MKGMNEGRTICFLTLLRPCTLSSLLARTHPLQHSAVSLPALDRALWLAGSCSPAFFLDRTASIYDPLAAPGPDVLSPLARPGGCPGVVSPPTAWPSSSRRGNLGMSWLTVGLGLWQMIFRPAARPRRLLFSQRDDEAVHLLTFRLRVACTTACRARFRRAPGAARQRERSPACPTARPRWCSPPPAAALTPRRRQLSMRPTTPTISMGC